ncbi:hypothetical protein MTO96_028380 [Rhipicephalus appendiculatus]
MLVPVYGPTAADAGRRKTADGGLPAQAAAATAAPPTAAAAEGSLAQPPPPPPAPSPMKPCREFCHRVEEQCPYFHPAAREQYAGGARIHMHRPQHPGPTVNQQLVVRTAGGVLRAVPRERVVHGRPAVQTGRLRRPSRLGLFFGRDHGGGPRPHGVATVLCALGDRGGDGGDSVVGGGPDPRPAQNPLLIAPAAAFLLLLLLRASRRRLPERRRRRRRHHPTAAAAAEPRRVGRRRLPCRVFSCNARKTSADQPQRRPRIRLEGSSGSGGASGGSATEDDVPILRATATTSPPPRHTAIPTPLEAARQRRPVVISDVVLQKQRRQRRVPSQPTSENETRRRRDTTQ